MEKWLEDVESGLKAPDRSSDLVVLNSLLKKHGELEEDVASHRDRLQVLVDTALEFQQEKHFLADEIQERVDQVVHRYVSVCPFSHFSVPFCLSLLYIYFLTSKAPACISS